MEKTKILMVSSIALIVLGILMIALGVAGTQIILPPIVTGIGFIVIAWVFIALRN